MEENLIENHTPLSIQKPEVWKFSRLCPETSTKLYVYEFGFGTISDTKRPDRLADTGIKTLSWFFIFHWYRLHSHLLILKRFKKFFTNSCHWFTSVHCPVSNLSLDSLGRGKNFAGVRTLWVASWFFSLRLYLSFWICFYDRLNGFVEFVRNW